MAISSILWPFNRHLNETVTSNVMPPDRIKSRVNCADYNSIILIYNIVVKNQFYLCGKIIELLNISQLTSHFDLFHILLIPPLLFPRTSRLRNAGYIFRN